MRRNPVAIARIALRALLVCVLVFTFIEGVLFRLM